jgi:hypothetical protein
MRCFEVTMDEDAIWPRPDAKRVRALWWRARAKRMAMRSLQGYFPFTAFAEST